jgi:hypothetical protein
LSPIPRKAIIVIGSEDPAEGTIGRATEYDEVFVIARAVADPSERWLIDDAHARAQARARLTRTLARLRARGVHALGAVGDENAAAAHEDARALHSTAETILS